MALHKAGGLEFAIWPVARATLGTHGGIAVKCQSCFFRNVACDRHRRTDIVQISPATNIFRQRSFDRGPSTMCKKTGLSSDMGNRKKKAHETDTQNSKHTHTQNTKQTQNIDTHTHAARFKHAHKTRAHSSRKSLISHNKLTHKTHRSQRNTK